MGVSRQRKWQIKNQEAGRCPRCGGPLGVSSHTCDVCLIKHRTRERNRKRRKAGIPLDAPLRPGGRGRKLP
jgi:hypothetical protein